MAFINPFAAAYSAAIGRGSSIAGGLARSVALAHADAAMGGWTSAISRMACTESNAIFQNLYPAIDQTISLWYQKEITDAQLKELLEAQGVDYEFVAVAGEHKLRRAWRSFVQNSRPRYDPNQYWKWWKQGRVTAADLREIQDQAGLGNAFEVALFEGHWEELPIDTALTLWYRGLLTDARLIQILISSGLRGDDITQFLAGARQPISAGDAIALHRRALIGRAAANEILGWQGYKDDATRAALLDGASERLSIPEAMVLFNRRKVGWPYLQSILDWHGVKRPEDQANYGELLKAMPTPSDLVNFSVRDVWQEDVVRRFGYDEEFPPEFQYWMRQQGFDWGEAVPLGGGAVSPVVPWPQIYWRAHWRALSPEQAFVLHQRFRGDPDNPITWSVPGIRPFTEADVDTVLKIADYPPAMRGHLRSVSFIPLRLIDIRNAVKKGRKDLLWAKEKFLDRGNSPENATFLAESAIFDKADDEIKKMEVEFKGGKRRMARETLRQYRNGYLSAAQARANLVSVGWIDEVITMYLTSEIMSLQNQTLEETTRRVKNDWMNGRTTEPEARARLAVVNVRRDWIDQLITRWRNERGEYRIMAAAAKVIKWYKLGLLSRQNAILRLQNLGWYNPDIILQLQEADYEVASAQARLHQQEDKRRTQAAKDLELSLRGLNTVQHQVQSELRRITPVATLRTWLKKELITVDEFVRRMTLQGYPPETSRYHVAEIAGEIAASGLPKGLTNGQARAANTGVETGG